MTKKIVSMLLIATMCFGSFAGCGKNNENSTDVSASEKSEVESGEVATSESEKVEEDELEFVTLKFISIGDANETADKVFFEKLNERTRAELNCEVEVQNLSWADYKTQYSLIMSSGEAWDAVFTASWCFYSQYANDGTFRELTEEDFQKYMPLTYEGAKDSFDSVRIDGKMYMVPQSYPEYNDMTTIAVRGDIMQEAGLEKITTVDELETYLDYTVANHSDMSAIEMSPSYIIIPVVLAMLDLQQEEGGYSIMDTEQTVGLFSGKFLAPYILDYSDPANITFVEEEAADEYNLKLLNKIHEWQEKGYWDEECLSSQSQINTLYNAGQGAFAIRQALNCSGYVRSLRKEFPEADARYYRLTEEPLRRNGGMANGIAFNAMSENAERAMMVVDLLNFDQELNDLLKYGVEGVHYELTDEGRVQKLGDVEYGWSVPTSMGFQPACKRDEAGLIDEYYELIEEKGGSNSICPIYTTFTFNTSELPTELAAVNDVNARYLDILRAGLAEDTEAFYYEYKDALKKAGYDALLEALLEQIQIYYDSFN